MDIRALLGVDADELREQIIEQAVAEVMSGERYDLLGEVKSVVRARAAEEAEKIALAQTEAIVQETIRGALDGTFQPVDTWGEATGPKTTIRGLFTAAVENFYSETVLANGKRPSGYSREEAKTRAEWIAAEAVKEHVNGLLSGEMRTIVQQASAAMKKEVAEAISTFVVRNFK